MAREMLHGLLTTDPERRLGLKDIKAHPWFRLASETPIPQSIGIKIGQNAIPVDANVLQ